MYVLVRHKVKDFSTWKKVYDSYASERDRAGLVQRHIFRNADLPEEVVVLSETNDPNRVKEFANSPDLKEQLKKGGVVGQPDIYFLDDVSAIASIQERGRPLQDELEELSRLERESPDPEENLAAVEFVYVAPEAKQVFLSGNFNNWDKQSLPMTRNRRGQWKATVKLPPGRYEYRYFADGEWAVDRRCAEVMPGKTLANCVIDVAPKMAA